MTSVLRSAAAPGGTADRVGPGWGGHHRSSTDHPGGVHAAPHRADRHRQHAYRRNRIDEEVPTPPILHLDAIQGVQLDDPAFGEARQQGTSTSSIA
jgi:hypothetical protein